MSPLLNYASSPCTLVFKPVLCEYCACCKSITQQQHQKATIALSSPGPLSAGHHFISPSSVGEVVTHALSPIHAGQLDRLLGTKCPYDLILPGSSLPRTTSPKAAHSPFLCLFVPSCFLRADVIRLMKALRHRLCVSVTHFVFM